MRDARALAPDAIPGARPPSRPALRCHTMAPTPGIGDDGGLAVKLGAAFALDWLDDLAAVRTLSADLEAGAEGPLEDARLALRGPPRDGEVALVGDEMELDDVAGDADVGLADRLVA